MEKKGVSIEAATIKEIARALDLISHLQAYVSPLIPAKNEMEQATIIFQEIMSSLSQSISTLDSFVAAQLASKKMKGIHHEDIATTVKRRRVNDSTTVFTTMPFCDGYQWRKYGEKDIKNSQFRRTYYKCINEECKARKKVQQQDKDEPSNFMLIYDMQHTCNDNILLETNQLNFFTMDSSASTSTSTLNFGPMLESSSFMMNKQQEQTSSAISDHFQIQSTEKHDDLIVAKAVQGAESTIVENMAGISSPWMPPLNLNENENWWEEFFKPMDAEFANLYS